MAGGKKAKRRPGRPVTPPDEARVKHVSFWVTEGERLYMRRLAKLRSQSLSAMCRDFIFDHVALLSRRGTLYPDCDPLPALPPATSPGQTTPETNTTEVTDASDD